ncbi:hypothetical protein QE152_g17066 [Popillia japonica]|uniref:Homer protein n=1 Tax=Popillia japonica TaxID=7064 RepID=A0AAW1L5X8_POPJA
MHYFAMYIRTFCTNANPNTPNNSTAQLECIALLLKSSANARKWEIELATLKTNNARLTSALQESTANVEEWKRQLHTYKEENLRMKTKYQLDLENSKGGGDIADELRKDNQALRQRIEQLESELDGKNNEIKQMKTSDVVQMNSLVIVTVNAELASEQD